MKTVWEAEVCVIGGGPSGSTIARKMALLGHDVCLIERMPFPRPHIGESLSPAIVPLLDLLGLRQRIEDAAFLRPDRYRIRWSSTTEQGQSRPGPPGFQVDRGRFDQLLLRAAEESGVRRLQPWAAMRPIRGAQGWRVPVRHGGQMGTVQCTFLVDAAGRQYVLPSKKTRCGVPTLALYAYWRDTGLRGAETRVEDGPEQWFWGAPLPDGSFNATVFIDPARCARGGRKQVEELYRSLLANTTLLRTCLEGQRTSPIAVCDASTYFLDPLVNDCSIKVGEASFSIDPLSSQGVHAAMLSAFQGSVVAHTIITRPSNASIAMQFYRARRTETIALNMVWATRCYASQQRFRTYEFWQSRATRFDKPTIQAEWVHNSREMSQDCRVQVSKATRLIRIPTIVNNHIETVMSVTHPGLERPIAYLNDVEVVPLLRDLSNGGTIGQAVERWSRTLSVDRCWEIMRWMWSRSIIVPLCEQQGISDARVLYHLTKN